ncbi:MAG: hypothetical protein ACE5KM_20290, partial [Planctomycetaceae bacterium]
MPAKWISLSSPSRFALLVAIVCVAHFSLRTAAANGVRTAEPPGAIVAEAHYTATIEEGVARISCRFVVNALRDAWTDVPIDFGQAVVGTLTPGNGQPETAFLRGVGDGRFILSVKSKGRHTFRLDLLSRVHATPAVSRFSFSGPPAGIATLDLTLPNPNQTVIVNPAFVPGAVKPVAGKTRVFGNLTAAETITVAWGTKPAAQPAGKPDVTADNTTVVRLRDAGLFTESRLDFTVLRGSVSQFAIAVQGDHRILDVETSAGTAAGWSVTRRGATQRIGISLKRPISRRLVVRVRTQRSISDGVTALAGIDDSGKPSGIHAVGVARETGLVAVATGESWDVALDKPEGWLPLVAGDVPSDRRAANAVAYYRYYNPAGALQATIASVKPQVTVSHAVQFGIGEVRLSVDTRLSYRIGNPGWSTAVLQLPDGLTIERVSGEHVKSFAVDETQDPRIVRIAFNRRMTGGVSIRVRGWVDLAELERPADLKLPLIEPKGVGSETGRIRIAAADSLDVAIDASQSAGLTLATGSEATHAGEFRTVAERTFSHRPVRAVVRLTDSASTVFVRVGTTLSLRESSTRVVANIDYDVRHAPLQRFRFAVPDVVVDRLHVRDSRGTLLSARKIGPLKQPPVDAGKTSDGAGGTGLWSVVEIDSGRPAVGKRRFTVTWESPHETPIDSSGDSATSLTFVPLRVTGVAGESAALKTILTLGEVTLKTTRSLKIDVSNTAHMERIAVRRLRRPPSPDGPHFRYFLEPAVLNLSVTQLVTEPVDATVVARGLVEVLLRDGPTATYRCRYRIRSSERQRLRLDLPKSSKPLAVFVDGVSVPLERDAAAKTPEQWSAFLIDVSKRDASTAEFALVVQFQMPLKPAPFQSAFGRLRLLLPRVMNAGDSPAIVRELRTAIWLPKSFALVGGANTFARRTGTSLRGLGPQVTAGRATGELERWIGVRSPGMLAFPVDGHVYRFDSVGGGDRLEVAFANMPFLT